MFSRDQVKLLRQLGPGYRKAIQAEKVDDFYANAYLIWFDHFPEPRHIDMDADEYSWAISCRKAVCAWPVIDGYLTPF